MSTLVNTSISRPSGSTPPAPTAEDTHGAAASQVVPGVFINIVPPATDQPADADLRSLAQAMLEPATDPPDGSAFDNHAIPAGYTYFSQFVDHDLTGQNSNALFARPGFSKRTAALDLDVIYGTATIESWNGTTLTPTEPPALPKRIYAADGASFVLEKTAAGSDDLPRIVGADGKRGDPNVPDARNDENLIVSQIDLAMLKFHNAVVAHLASTTSLRGAALFTAAYRTVVNHYQWIVLHDFVPRLVRGFDIAGGRAYVAAVRADANKRYSAGDVAKGMPAEFSVGAYRLGHSMVRFNYRLNDAAEDEREVFSPLHPDDDLHGHREYPSDAIIEWKHFLNFQNAPRPGDASNPSLKQPPQFSMKLDTGLSYGLSDLPIFSFANPSDSTTDRFVRMLSYRNLNRGATFSLPTGQTVAAFYGFAPKNFTILGRTVQSETQRDADFEYGPEDERLTATFAKATPLWYYILKEAQDPGGPAGAHLGELGSRILAECFLAFAEVTRDSIFTSGFEPKAGQFGCTTDGDYQLVHLIRFATGQ